MRLAIIRGDLLDQNPLDPYIDRGKMATIDHFPWRFDHWQKVPEKLKGHYSYVSVSIYEDSTGVVYSEEVVADEDIPRLCEQTASLRPDTKWSSQLLVTCGVAQKEVPYSLNAIRALCSYWRLPYNYIPEYLGIATVTMPFVPVLDDSAWKGFSSTSDQTTAVVTYNSLTHQTFGVCTVITANDLTRFKRRLEASSGFASNPFFAPVVLTSLTAHDLRRDCIQAARACVTIEESMGYWSEEGMNQLFDFTQIPQDLKTVGIHITAAGYMSSLITNLLGQLENQLRSLSNEHYPSVSIELLEQVVYLQRCMGNVERILKQARENLQSMVQTGYANRQQRDNQLNHRYGADMRLITTITLIFLPGTFVATFFSTTFWNFSPDNSGTKVTYWVYLYFVVTISLTLLVLVVWRKFSALKQLATKIVQIGHRTPLLGKIMRKKKMEDEETGKKGD